MATISFPNLIQALKGLVVSETIAVPPSSFGDLEMKVADPISPEKQWHLRRPDTDFGLEDDAAPATSTTYTFFAGRVRSDDALALAFRCGLRDTGTQADTNDFVFDVKRAAEGSATKTTLLSGTVTVDSAVADNTAVAGTLSVTDLSEGDCVYIEVTTPAAITGAVGMWAEFEFKDKAA